jgi:LysR family glycine cleavage system transcriptional activator
MSCLISFDAVARHQSVTQAAEELCLSASAVSKQIAVLEDFVGRPLLRKEGRGVQLTVTGREYWLKISPSLRTIEAATAEARDEGGNSGLLVLASVPTFLTQWLIPRLPDFKWLYPSATFVFRPPLDLRESFPSDIDAAISHGLSDWHNVTSEYIAGREFVCICSPELIKTSRPIRKPGDLVAHTLLHLEHAPLAWRKWAAHHGLSAERTQHGLYFSQYSAVIQAVLSGLGVGLVPGILVEKQLQEGLAIAFRNFCYEDQGHHLCFRNDRSERPVFAAFRNWLLEQGRGEPLDASVAGGAVDTVERVGRVGRVDAEAMLG